MLPASAGWATDVREPGIDLGTPAALETLDQHRARATDTRLELNLQETTAAVEDNLAIHTISGRNVITEGAFANASGLPIAIQNSGNNNVIQNSVILNLKVQ
jgi:hypothetical protein